MAAAALVVLHALGGIGKTQLTVAYMKRHKDNYSAIFWLNIKDEYSLKQSFVNIARQILREHPLVSQLSNLDLSGDLDRVIDGVKAWLSLPKNTRWLMAYDNYDNPKLPRTTDPRALDVKRFLPEAYQGSVIITTRSSQVKIGHNMQVRKLENTGDSLQILSNASRREGLIDDPDALSLVKELDGLPLALAMAGAYLDQVAMSLSEDLHFYQESWAKLQKTSPELILYENRMLYSIWQLSFDHVEQKSPPAANLLRLWAYFDNQDIWLELLQPDISEFPDWIRELTADAMSFHAAMRVLTDHELVETDMSWQERCELRGYNIHACVHSWTIHVLNREWNYEPARLAVRLVASHVREEQYNKPWLTRRRFLQYAARCSYNMLNVLVTDDDIAWAFNNLGTLYDNQGKHDLAAQLYQRALRGYERALGPEHK